MFLGIDIGTSAVKTVILTYDTGVICEASVPLTVSRPKPLWSEQNPDDWWWATCAAIQKLPAEYRQEVKAIGLSGQMHGAVLLDKHNKPLRPAILWNDGRSFQECEALERSEPEFRNISANRVMPGFTAPKLQWVRKHEPHIFDQITKVLLPKDYIRFRLTGEFASEMSDSSGSLWLDTKSRCWSSALLSATGLNESQMPRLVEGTEITGALKTRVADELGLSVVPVVGGGGDNAAGAVGAGVISPGQSFLSLGTSGVIFLAGEICLPSPETGVHAFCHALPDRWHQMSVMLSAASCLDWATRLTNVSGVETFVGMAAAKADLNGSTIFLPYLSGERTPHNDPMARGVFFGMDHETDTTALAQAVLEGVAFGFADGFDTLKSAGGNFDTMSVIGGGSRSQYWGRILAAAMDQPLSFRKDAAIGPAFGAARLAMIGLEGAEPGDICVAPELNFEVMPSAADVEILADKRHRYRRLYQSLKSEFQS